MIGVRIGISGAAPTRALEEPAPGEHSLLRIVQSERLGSTTTCFPTDATAVIGVVQTGGDRVLAVSPAAYTRPDCGDDFDGRR
jgi:hypothetical protein